jgi:hypothetical protein
VAHAFEVGDAIGEVRLRVGDRLVVDRGANFRQAVIQEQPGLQVAELLVEVLGGVPLER